MLQKWFRSWEALAAAKPGRPLEIHIVSNWAWTTGDELAAIIGGQCNAVKDEFYTAAATDKLGRLRVKLATHLGTTEARLREFFRALRFHFGYACWQAMAAHTAERMEYHDLKSDETALLVAVGIARDWVKTGRHEITRDVLEAVIDKHNLRLPTDARPAAYVYFSTIKEQLLDIEPEYKIDWRHYFLGSPSARGHEPMDPADWNGKMLPELHDLEARINIETKKRLIRVRGLARLSPGSPSGTPSRRSPITRSRWIRANTSGRRMPIPALISP